ncbi:MAG: hypothetical protein KJS97_02100 [Alphaproteobacteria bacterium]|nr:hypothetical protein [Alphaproteobacteria bacterium]
MPETNAAPATLDALKAALHADRLASYARLRGGFPIPLAGAAYWAVLAGAGTMLDLRGWITIAMWGSGAIFPLALLLAAIFRCDFMRDRTATSDLLFPTFASMFLFWPMLIPALQTAPELGPLILAIGMSIHWPVIGWSYARSGLFTAHAVVRAALVLAIWTALPDARLTLLPAAVAGVYLVTVAAMLIDSARVRANLAAA